MRRVASLLLAPLLAGGLAACASTVSTTSFTGADRAVAQRVSDYQSHVAAGEAKQVCQDDLSAALRARLGAGGGSCTQAVKRQLVSVDDYEATVVKNGIAIVDEATAVKNGTLIVGATATARVSSTWSGKARTVTLQLVKQSGGWRIAGLSLKYGAPATCRPHRGLPSKRAL